jgi:hypothetical protein
VARPRINIDGEVGVHRGEGSGVDAVGARHGGFGSLCVWVCEWGNGRGRVRHWS